MPRCPHHRSLPVDAALILLTFFVNARPVYMARNYPPSLVQGPLEEFDKAVDACLARICQVPNFDNAWRIPTLRGLPVDIAGLAIIVV
jgi:hypothetical protein